jgi:protein arginine kinase activator
MDTYGTTWCERCGQNAAVAEITASDGETVRLCAACSAQWETAQGGWAHGAAHLAAGLTRREGAAALLCPRCGFDVEDLVRLGRVGCPECYGAFADQVADMLDQAMPYPHHSGKWPKRWTNGRERGPQPR